MVLLTQIFVDSVRYFNSETLYHLFGNDLEYVNILSISSFNCNNQKVNRLFLFQQCHLKLIRFIVI